MITYRKLKLNEDYPELEKFWKLSKMKTPPPIDILPLDGWVACSGGTVVGAIFMWLASNSNVSFIGFPIIDPLFVGEERKEILPTLFDKAESTATYLGYKYSMHYTPIPYLEDFLLDRGYITGDKNVVHLLKLIN